MSDDIQQKLDLPQLDQVGFVVRDLEASMAVYAPMFGPFSVMDPGAMSYNYRGAQEECEMRLAFGKSGDVEIELIQWLRGGCPHKEFIDAGREGMFTCVFESMTWIAKSPRLKPLVTARSGGPAIARDWR